MRACSPRYCFLLLLTVLLFSCKKETELFDDYDYQPERLQELLPLQTGKFITYRLDSTVFTNFNQNKEVHSYQEKQLLDAEITDNLGRKGFRIFRFLRNQEGTSPWLAAGSYVIVPTKNSVEVIENNLRQVVLLLPLQQYFSWKGNRYLANNPYSSMYNFSNDNSMNEWDYTYDGVDETIELNGQTIDHVYTVSVVNESTNVPLSSPDEYASINFVENKYAKNIGLVFQQNIMWEYQPNTGNASPYYTGFGVKRTMIDHN